MRWKQAGRCEVQTINKQKVGVDRPGTLAPHFVMLRYKRHSGSKTQNQGWLARQKGPGPQELILRRLAKSQQNWQGHPALGNLARPKANPDSAAGPHGFVREPGA